VPSLSEKKKKQKKREGGGGEKKGRGSGDVGKELAAIREVGPGTHQAKKRIQRNLYGCKLQIGGEGETNTLDSGGGGEKSEGVRSNSKERNVRQPLHRCTYGSVSHGERRRQDAEKRSKLSPKKSYW